MMNAPMDQGPPKFAMVRVPAERSWTNFASTVPFPEHRIQLNRIGVFGPRGLRLEARGWRLEAERLEAGGAGRCQHGARLSESSAPPQNLWVADH
jgi:hypothetical protein